MTQVTFNSKEDIINLKEEYCQNLKKKTLEILPMKEQNKGGRVEIE